MEDETVNCVDAVEPEKRSIVDTFVCDVCPCLDYVKSVNHVPETDDDEKPATSPDWPLCTCGHYAEDHN